MIVELQAVFPANVVQVIGPLASKRENVFVETFAGHLASRRLECINHIVLRRIKVNVH